MTVKKKSRRVRYESARQLVAQASEEFEELRTELQDWLDNMPENLQESAKAEELQDTISMLDEAIDSAADIAYLDIDFPRMFG